MGHSRSDIYDKFYTNQTVASDTESAFLGTASQDWVLNLAGHLSLTRDPRAPEIVKSPTQKDIDGQPAVRSLCEEVASLQKNLIQVYGTLKRAHNAGAGEPLTAARKELSAARKRTGREMLAVRWSEHFTSVGTSEIHRQRTGQNMPSQAPQQPRSYEFKERSRLAELLCRNDDVAKFAPADVVERRVAALTAMTGLCQRKQAARQRGVCEFSEDADMEPEPNTDRLDGNQCPWCLHDTMLSLKQRQFRYVQLRSLRIHIEGVHFRNRLATLDPALISDNTSPYDCPFTRCGLSFGGENHIKNHLASTHNLFCSASEKVVEYDLEKAWD